jgi:glycosyltransferase involved in cell wall biosynthesis
MHQYRRGYRERFAGPFWFPLIFPKHLGVENNVNIRNANSLEREGKLIEAFKKNLEIASNSTHTSIAPMAKANARRILARLNESIRLDAEKLLAKVEENRSEKNHSPYEFSLVPPSPRKDLPLISVVVPCYNCENYLPETIKSLINQTYQRYEVILVDDFSTDKTPEIAKAASKNDKRFRFFQHRANGGLSSSRNSGIRLAKGEYVCFLDSDDLLAPQSLENRVNALLQAHDKNIVAGVFDQSIPIPENFSGTIESKATKPTKDYVDFISTQGDCPFNANQPMLKRAILVELGGFPEKYPQAEDWRLWSKAMRAGYIFLAVNFVGSGYRQAAGSMIRRAPLLHVEKSLGNLFRAHKPYNAETDPFELKYENQFFAAPLFIEPAGEYEAKRMFLPRLLNFTGIEYARCLSAEINFTPGHAAKEIGRFMPDFTIAFTGYSLANAMNWFSNGVKRYNAVSSLSHDENEAARKFVGSFLELLGVEQNNGVSVGSALLLVPSRNLVKNPPQSVDVVFIPHKKYHTQSFELLLPYLREQGLSYLIVDISVPYRDENAHLESVDEIMISYNEFIFSRIMPRSIVCMNDWDTVVKPLVKKANQHGIPTIGIVEGVQDYHDVDTGRKRNPYREVTNVFLTGSFDRRYFAGTKQNLFDIGVQRLEGLTQFTAARKLRKQNAQKTVVLNVNFSYGVMVEKRGQWVKDVADACARTGYRLLISQHPQDDGDFSAYKVDKRPLYDLLVEADIFISRFSGAILESLVIGCPTIYFNGHGEKIDKFYDSLGAYEVAENFEDLVLALSHAIEKNHTPAEFLFIHGGFSQESIVERTTKNIFEVLQNSMIKDDAILDFKRSILC